MTEGETLIQQRDEGISFYIMGRGEVEVSSS
jgi:hypothetical protein